MDQYFEKKKINLDLVTKHWFRNYKQDERHFTLCVLEQMCTYVNTLLKPWHLVDKSPMTQIQRGFQSAHARLVLRHSLTAI